MKKCKLHTGYIIKKHPMGKNFLGICLFGTVFSIRPLNSTELNHELIHAAQQKELLYIPFFIWYGIEWLVLYFKYKNWMVVYYHIRINVIFIILRTENIIDTNRQGWCRVFSIIHNC